jgi:succinate dehydrogenase flavin-adding protein (antitoxin of CptAB toxin-antitoxin module)
MSDIDDGNDRELLNRVRRLMRERDILLGAIAPEDYAKVKDQIAAISESPDQ